MKIYCSHSSSFDYKNEFYKPLELSRVAGDHRLLFPHRRLKTPVNTKDIIKESDLVLAEVSFASTGQGIELGWADEAGVPIMGVYRKGARISSSVRIVAKLLLEYENLGDMVAKVQKELDSLL